ncbi:MAG: glycosyltransferase family protein [Thermoproteus sp.]
MAALDPILACRIRLCSAAWRFWTQYELRSELGLIDKYLADERERMEVAGSMRDRCLARHTYLHRAEELLDAVA